MSRKDRMISSALAILSERTEDTLTETDPVLDLARETLIEALITKRRLTPGWTVCIHRSVTDAAAFLHIDGTVFCIQNIPKRIWESQSCESNLVRESWFI